MSTSCPRPFPEARLLGLEEAPPAGAHVWVYEGTLERFTDGGARFAFVQRIAWPEEADDSDEVDWNAVRELGLWMVERLSVNGHLLIGLRARPEGMPSASGRLILPDL